MKTTYKTVFLGNSSVGKTTIMAQYLYKKIEASYGPTIGLDFVSTTMTLSGKQVRLQLWDTAGQERFNSLIPNYTRNSFITIVVYDYTNEESFDRIDYWINDLVRINDPDKKIKIVIVANKRDLIPEDKYEKLRCKGVEKANLYSATFVDTYALSYSGITKLVDCVHNLIEEDLRLNPESENALKDIINLEDNRKTRCCGGFY